MTSLDTLKVFRAGKDSCLSRALSSACRLAFFPGFWRSQLYKPCLVRGQAGLLLFLVIQMTPSGNTCPWYTSSVSQNRLVSFLQFTVEVTVTERCEAQHQGGAGGRWEKQVALQASKCCPWQHGVTNENGLKADLCSAGSVAIVPTG